ncbi:MAG: glycosyl hydrolase [Clostridia bacterium]|nr:glycosyl hydrolase [Clostridia bacterium]
MIKIETEETRPWTHAQGVSVVPGPACNIKRSPLCGRNFEYISEDPYLSSQMAKQYIQGVQSQGVGTSIKHFCANNQESRRMTIDTIVDERTLREIYLASFETAIREAQPATVMCSYNKVNGTYLSDNRRLLTEVLREEWGYQGLVVSDWGAVNDRVAGVTAGMDLEMPSSGGMNDRKVVAAVREGRLSESDVDVMAGRVLDLVYTKLDTLKKTASFDAAVHDDRARSVASQCAVLLKNSQAALPLQKDQPVAVIGRFAEHPRFQGGGSSHINPTHLTAALDEIRKSSPAAVYQPGFRLDTDAVETADFDAAVATAQSTGIAVIFAGLPDHYESEGYDRKHLHLPPNQDALIAAVAAVCPRTIVVLANGSPIEMPWVDEVEAILEGYLHGQAGGGAIADLLFGHANPSGKLAETFPLRLEDNPSYLDFPGINDRVEYREGLYVGYRYYDKRRMDVLFPFGHGLSYTQFSYSDLVVSAREIRESDVLTVSVTVQNTGARAGREVIQLYLSYPEAKVDRVPQELKGFAKIELQPGESKTVTIPLDRRSFAYYDVKAHDWLVEAGPVEIRVGASSRDIRLNTVIQIQAERHATVTFSLNATKYDLMAHPAAAAIAGPFFAKIGSLFNLISAAKDGAGQEGTGSELLPPEPATATKAGSDADDSFAMMLAEMEAHLPLRAFVLLSMGHVQEHLLLTLIDQINEAMTKGSS